MIKEERLKSFTGCPPGWTATFRWKDGKEEFFTVPVVGWAVLELVFDDGNPDETEDRLSVAVLIEPDHVALVSSPYENDGCHELQEALVSIQGEPPPCSSGHIPALPPAESFPDSQRKTIAALAKALPQAAALRREISRALLAATEDVLLKESA